MPRNDIARGERRIGDCAPAQSQGSRAVAARSIGSGLILVWLLAVVAGASSALAQGRSETLIVVVESGPNSMDILVVDDFELLRLFEGAQETIYVRYDEWKSGPLPTLRRVIVREVPSAGNRRALLERSDADISFDLPPKDFAELGKAGRLQVTSYPVDATDLSPFRDRGGKLLIWQPQTGGPFSPQDMVNWYTELNGAMHGNPNTFARVQRFARLFLLPGVNHCSGGIGCSLIDPFSPVVDWVENGLAPASIVGTAPNSTPWPGRTRPLCPYPQYAHYKGSGDINVAANFECRSDRADDDEAD